MFLSQWGWTCSVGELFLLPAGGYAGGEGDSASEHVVAVRHWGG